jgi:preprotein translocase subunit SecG
MFPVLLTVHIVVSVLLVLLIMIQSGRSGGFSNLMGGGGGDALFSTSGQQSGLRKATIVLAGIFFATSIGLTLVSTQQSGRSVLQRSFPQLPPVPNSSTEKNGPISQPQGSEAQTKPELDSTPAKK